MQSALYQGWVRHRRREPVRNDFRYRLYLLYLDLAELPLLAARHAAWSNDRPNLAWFRRADYLGDPRLPLEESVRALVEARTGKRPAGPIRMLTQVRTLGYVFNPVTFYYCFDANDQHVETLVAEITNTPWFERHSYVLERAEAEVSGRRQRFRFPKTFHVSPFMEMAMDYDWTLTEPGERLFFHIESSREGRTVLDATLALRRSPLNGRSLARVLVRQPLITFKVTAAIYLQALRLWWKRVPFVRHPKRGQARAKGVRHVESPLQADPAHDGLPQGDPVQRRHTLAARRAATRPQPPAPTGARPPAHPGRTRV